MRTLKKWTEQEERYILNWYRTYSITQIANELGRSARAVGVRARLLGLYAEIPKRWTKEEINFIKKNYRTMRYDEIAKKLGRTRKGVVKLLTNLNLRRHAIHRWTNKDKVYLRVSYGKISSDIIAQRLGISKTVLHQAAIRFRVSKNGSKNFTPDELEFIEKNLSGMTHKQIGMHLGRTPHSIENVVRRQRWAGLRFRKNKPFTPDEHEYVVKNYLTMKLKDIGKHLGKTEQHIANHCRKYKLIKQAKRRISMPDDFAAAETMIPVDGQ